MKLGFVGTGAITSAMVTGLSAACVEPSSISLSPRNPAIAADLANRFPRVSVASSNQGVLDGCETVVLAVRPQIAGNVLSDLRFRPDHHVISIVSALSLWRVFELVTPARRVTRAVPLPSAVKRRSPTAIYPRNSAAVDLFASLGTAFEVDTEDEFDALCTATAAIASHLGTRTPYTRSPSLYAAYGDRQESGRSSNRALPPDLAQIYYCRAGR